MSPDRNQPMQAEPMHPSSSPPRKPRIVLLAPVALIAALVLVYTFADLSALRSPERVAEAARSLRDSPLGLVYVVLGFSVGTLLFLPVTALIVGTTLAFDPMRGFAFALTGALVGASITYWAGRLSGSAALDYASGPRLARVREALRTHAFRASIIARLLPVGNFTAINLLAGSMRIPFRAFFFGNLIGLVPGVLCMTLFSEQITELIRDPNPKNVGIAIAAALLLVLLSLGLRRLAGKRQVRTEESDAS